MFESLETFELKHSNVLNLVTDRVKFIKFKSEEKEKKPIKNQCVAEI